MRKIFFIIALFTAGCTTRTITEEKTHSQNTVLSEEDRAAVQAVLRCINDESQHSCSLLAEGSITLRDGNSSQSGHFELKSKRLTGDIRIDSLSMIVTGPFGITGAKFLGSPQEYQFYNAIEGEKYRGRPDPKTLQGLTGMKGLTLQSLSDVIYGLAPNISNVTPEDSITLKDISEYRHILYIIRSSGVREAITLNGKLPKSENEKIKLNIVQYDRWNQPPPASNTKPDITVNYQGTYENKDFLLPNYIVVHSGSTELELEYTSADQNPKQLTVKIKMPQ